MLNPRNSNRSSGGNTSVGTVMVVVLVIAGVLGWAIYDAQEPISVRNVPTETITVPAPTPPGPAPTPSPQG